MLASYGKLGKLNVMFSRFPQKQRTASLKPSPIATCLATSLGSTQVPPVSGCSPQPESTMRLP